MKKRIRATVASVAVLTTVLVAGFLLGLAWDSRLGAEAVETSERSRDRDRDGRGRRLVIDGVGLSVEQRSDVDSIIEVYRGRMSALHREFRAEYDPKYRALILETREAVKSVLTAEQVAEYDSLLAEFDRKREERRRSKGGRRSGDERE